MRFLTRSGGSALFLTPTEAVFTVHTKTLKRPAEKGSLPIGQKAQRAIEKGTETALRMQMVGSDPKASALEQQALPGRINYMIGNNPHHWHTGVPTFGRMGVHGVYPGVDLVYYGNQRNLEYDFLVAPHADPKQIQLHFAGAQSVHVNAAGALVVQVQGREWRWQRPAVYQQDGKGKHSIAARFRLQRLMTGQTGVSFALGRYDTDRALVIDPVLVYSTYVGGNGSSSANGIAVDSQGDAYIAGVTNSTNFPVSPGAFQSTTPAVRGDNIAFVTKLNPTGSALIYSTFLGGYNYDHGNAIAVDSQGNTYITGVTASTDFPVIKGAFQTGTAYGTNIDFVTKLHAVPILPDFNNDGFTDLLIQNASTHQIASWLMQGTKWAGGAYFSLTPPIDYALVGSGDFRGNGLTTLALQSRTTNQIAFWYTNGTHLATISGGDYVDVTPLAGWKVVGVADFNGDGKSDLLFQNQSTGQVAVWFMNGSTFAQGVFVSAVPDSGWIVVGVGDYNGDGYADLLLQNQTTNQAALWYLKNGIFTGGNRLSLAPPTGWKIVGPR